MARPRSDKILGDALVYALEWHDGTVRKETDIPYVSHLLAVCALVLEHGGTDKQGAAALLHDVAEDHGGEARLIEIRAQFGAQVERIVRDCSDSVTADPRKKRDWKPRKSAYIKHLASAPPTSLLVSCADKAHNAACIVADARRLGPPLWTRFNGSPSEQSWYYRSVADILSAKLSREPAAALARQLQRTVLDLEVEAAKAVAFSK